MEDDEDEAAVAFTANPNAPPGLLAVAPADGVSETIDGVFMETYARTSAALGLRTNARQHDAFLAVFDLTQER